MSSGRLGKAGSPFARLKAAARHEILAKVGWSIGGQLLPMLAGLIAVPFLLQELGTARFALLTLVWTLMGYFSLLDLGVSRALTYRIAQLSAADDAAGMERAARAGLSFLLGLGLFLALSLNLAAPAVARWIGGRDDSVPYEECVALIRIVSVGVLLVMVSAGLRGILEGRSRFRTLNLIQIPAGVLSFLAPAIIVAFHSSLALATASILVVRLAALVALATAGKLSDRRIRLWGRPKWLEFRLLIGFGFWVTVSSVISPLMTHGDRFFLVSIVTLDDLAYYTTTIDVIVRFLFIPSAAMAVFFPLLVQSRQAGQQNVIKSYSQSVKFMLALMVAIGGTLFIFCEAALALWLGEAFAEKSSEVARILIVGLAINGLAIAPFACIQAVGRPDLIAKLHACELPVYLAALIWLASAWGITGAAVAWTLRVTVDALILFISAHVLLVRNVQST